MAVDDGSPFCPACEAPQITFASRSSEPEVVRLHPETVPPSSLATAAPEGALYHPTRRSDRVRLLRAAIYAGAIAALLSTIPWGIPIAIPLAGILSVRFFRKAAFDLNVPPELGFRLGALSGLVMFGMLVLVSTISIVAQGATVEFRDQVLEMMRHYQAANPDPQTQQIYQYFQTPQGFVAMILLFLLLSCIIIVVLSGLAGLVSAALSQRRSGR